MRMRERRVQQGFISASLMMLPVTRTGAWILKEQALLRPALLG
jgi:hypothetical protein